MKRWMIVPVLCSTVFMTPWSAVAGRASDQDEEYLVHLYDHLAPSTIFLSVTYESVHPLSQPSTTGVGAGFLVDDAGTILTNAHVVDGADSITATLFDGTRVKADTLALDPVSDVAILSIHASGKKLVPVKLGNSDRLRIGQHTSVVGSPFGLGFTLTTGIISGLGPPNKRLGAGPARLIQTTAPINPGNSGGPLVDSRGRVIGITTAALLGAQNIGFAIPIDVAKQVWGELKEKGKLERPWLGVTGQFITEEIRTLVALPLRDGLLVEDVEEGSPAAKAGIRLGTIHMVVDGTPWVLGGDILLTLQGQSIRSAEAFAEVVKSLHVGQEVEVEWLRDGERLRTAIVLAARPSGSMRAASRPSPSAVGTASRQPMPIPLTRLMGF